jgi:BirA family biotin operon repressor/biotin-[acetyl-CoA-carboxylase] ligase
VLQSVDSTNAEAARISASLAGPEWILALEQTAAKGRRGRAWANPPGNFAATLVLPCDGEPVADMALRSFVSALALFETVQTVTRGSAHLTLKWPNDVLLDGAKLAGILLETVGPARLAIGIGVNLQTAPLAAELESRAVPPVSLAGETGVSISPEAFLDVLAQHYARLETQFRSLGFAPIRLAWLARAAKLGEPIVARTGSTEFAGTFTDIDLAGNLVLNTKTGLKHIAAADIYF